MNNQNIYFCKVAQQQFDFPSLRIGQAFYNVAYELYKDKMIHAQNDCDCFYVDAKIESLINYLFEKDNEMNS